MSPADGDSFTVGQSVSFSGSANDVEDGDLTAALTWASSLDGNIGSGGSFSTTALQVGSHTITAQATDSGGLTVSVQIGITVIGGSTIEVRVSSSTDDAEERTAGTVKLSSSDLELISDGTREQTVGMRFNGVNISQGAQILSAYVQFQVDQVDSGATSLVFQGEMTDSAQTFTSVANDISSRLRTTAAIAWSPVPWTTVNQVGPDQRTPDIATVIQEIVNRPGWLTGNSLAIIVTGAGERTAEAFDGVPSAAPLLHVEFVDPPT